MLWPEKISGKGRGGSICYPMKGPLSPNVRETLLCRSIGSRPLSQDPAERQRCVAKRSKIPWGNIYDNPDVRAQGVELHQNPVVYHRGDRREPGGEPPVDCARQSLSSIVPVKPPVAVCSRPMA